MYSDGKTSAYACAGSSTGTGLFAEVATQSEGVFNAGFRGFVETEITNGLGNKAYTQNELVLVMFLDGKDQGERLRWRWR